MDERYDPNLLLDYVEGELPDDARQRVEAMLADDPKLAALVRGMQQDRAALRAAEPGEVPRDLVEGALAKVEREMLLDTEVAVPSPTVAAPVQRWRIGPLLTYGGIAAVLALTATVVLQSLQSGSNHAPSATNDALAMRDEAAGVGLAEAPIKAQRQAAADEALAFGTEELDAVDGPGSDLLAGALAAAEERSADATTPTRNYFEGFDELSDTLSPATPAPDTLATTSFGSEAPGEAAFPVSGAPVALAPAEARYQVNVYTRSAELTRRDLEVWAYDNRIAIAEDDASSPSFHLAEKPFQAAQPVTKSAPTAATPAARSQPMARHEGEEDRARVTTVAESSQVAHAANQQLVLKLDQRQVNDLVQVLNRDTLRQNAIVLDNQTQIQTLTTAVAADFRPVTSPPASASPFSNEASGMGRSSGIQPDFEPDAASRSDFAFTESLNDVDVAANLPSDASVPTAEAEASPAGVGGHDAYSYFRYRSDRYHLGLNQAEFFEFPPSPAPLPWLQWTQPPEPPVLVQVVIEETPASLPPPASAPTTPARPAPPE